MPVILYLILSMSQLFARDCLKESWNFHVGMKLTYITNDLMDRYDAQKESLDVCDDKTKNEIWASELKELVGGYNEHKLELKRKGDISSHIVDFDYISEEKLLSHKELCVTLDQKIKEEEDCYRPGSYLQELKTSDFSRLSFREVCRKNLPVLYKNYKKCSRKK